MHRPPQGEVRCIAGYSVFSTSYDTLCAMVHTRLRTAVPTVLVFANTNFVLQCRSLRTWLNSENVIIVNDGVGMDIASLLLHGKRFRHNLNGTDFLPHLLGQMAGVHRIFLLGGKPGVAERAGQAITRNSGQQIVGSWDGYTPLPADQLCARINASGADVVLVALGNPLQEAWIATHMALLQARLFISVGALFDFMSGGVQRAPRWVQGLRLEWLYRLYQEPRRMLRRYTLDIAQFLWVCTSYPVARWLARLKQRNQPRD